jgi:NAD(P)-dependent dehydrogenase (short-subunit alcohol dehydrogenase family)
MDGLAATPLGGLANGAELATVALFLATSDASYTNGSIIVVDGRRTGVGFSAGAAAPSS